MSDFSFEAARVVHHGEEQLDGLAGERVFCSEFKYRRKSELFGEGEEAEYVYQIIAGAVRTYKLLSDGRRQINAFHLPGDLFGLENGPTHRFTAEAVIETKVRIIKRRSLLRTMISRETGATNLLQLIGENLKHAEDHLLLLGRKTATEKVAAFLLEMDTRQGQPRVMMLPMNRRDIGDYLGLTVETVSRALSNFRDRNILRFDGPTQRKVALLDRERLAERTQ
jgi:CRP/FNR family transcriptional regulator, nitrogen fixation regulation protein